jgi:hypothetical protein
MPIARQHYHQQIFKETSMQCTACWLTHEKFSFSATAVATGPAGQGACAGSTNSHRKSRQYVRSELLFCEL